MTSYLDADYAGCRVERKNTSGTCQFLKNCLVSWSSIKQNPITLSTAEAEYAATGAYCAQILWMKCNLLNYDLHYDHIKIFCDNTRTIHMSKNENQHSKTKHIEIWYHFFRDHYEKGDFEIDYISTDFQLANIFTKPLDYNRFSFICGELNICIMDTWCFWVYEFPWFYEFYITSHDNF